MYTGVLPNDDEMIRLGAAPTEDLTELRGKAVQGILTKNARQLTEPAGVPIGGTTMNVAYLKCTTERQI